MAKPTHSKHSHQKNKKNKKRRRRDDEQSTTAVALSPQDECAMLARRCLAEAPALGYAPPLNAKVTFLHLPLSQATQRALIQHKFTTMTAIQNACIPHALAGRDILGAAKTGSGKTLAFLIPLLECLYRHHYTPEDGPGALVLSPTRELAFQTFQVLRKVGQYHSTLSVGLLTGGKKDFFAEQERIVTTNIIMATPGRFLQHLEQTPYLDLQSSCQMLVLDEADRILDMGFRDQLLRILDYLPTQQRQTLLFSATQTKDVTSLATLSLQKDVQYLGVHDTTPTFTPERLDQSYVILPLAHKLNALYSFLQSHKLSKSIVFFSTCAQVRHAHELFCALRPGLVVLGLHGKLSQERRSRVYKEYCERRNNNGGVVLMCTDVCARGLDVPDIDWVVQMDAPEDRATYIHRVGRTARYHENGHALLLITPPEETYVQTVLLQSSGNVLSLPLQRLSINPQRATVVTERAASLVAANVRLQTLAKKAFQSYLRSLHLLPSSTVCLDTLDKEGYAHSLGLASTPNLQFLKHLSRTELRERKNVNHKLQRLKEQIKAEKLTQKLKAMDNTPPHAEAKSEIHDESEEDEDWLISKPTDPPNDMADTAPVDDLHALQSHRRGAPLNKKIVFDEQGNETTETQHFASSNIAAVDTQKQKAHIDAVRARLLQSKEQDEEDHRERVRQKHKKRRMESKPEREMTSKEVTLLEEEASTSSSSDDTSSSSSDSDSDDVDVKTQEEMALALIRGAK